MQYPMKARDDEERVRVLQRLQLLDSEPEEVFDALTRLASDLLGVPIALVSLVDASRQWFKSRVGLAATETPRDVAFCAHALHSLEPLVVPDATQDVRFHDNPLVVGGVKIRAYAGVPLRSQEGHALGTLCAIDQRPRAFTEREIGLLQDLARIAQREIHNRETALRARAMAENSYRVIAEREALYHATFDGAAVGMALVGRDGRWRMVNRRLCDILGRTAHELTRMSFREITHPADLAGDLELRERLLSGEIERGTREKRYLRADGGVVWASVEGSVTRDAEGRPDCLILAVEDITARREAEMALHELRQQLERRVEERTLELRQTNGFLAAAMVEQRRSEAALAESEARLSTVINDQTEVVCRFDAQGRITFANRACRLMFGLTDETLGQADWKSIVHPDDLPGVLTQIATSTVDQPVVVTEHRIVRPDGQSRWAEFVNHRFYGPQGELREVQTVGRDVTDRKLLERQLNELTGRLTDLYENAPCGYHSVGPDGRFLAANAVVLSWLGCEASDVIGKARPWDFFLNEPPERVARLFAEFIERDQIGPVEFDLRGRQGAVRRVSLRATAVKDEQGRFLMSRSVLFDITELHRVRGALEDANRQQHLMLDNDLVGIVKLKDRRAVWHNRAFGRIFGYGPGELVGQPARMLYPDDAVFERVGREAYPMLAAGKSYRAQLPLCRKSGEVLWMDVSGSALSAESGESLWMMLDVTQMKDRQDLAEARALHDALTGLPNRALLVDRMAQAIAGAARSGKCVAVCFMDLDGFKAVNDSLGHEAGDELLRTVAKRLLPCVRSHDTVARLGGDEFVLLLNHLNAPEEARPVLARACDAVAEPVALRDGRGAQVTASIGVAFYPLDAADGESLLALADKSMYEAKRAHQAAARAIAGASGFTEASARPGSA